MTAQDFDGTGTLDGVVRWNDRLGDQSGYMLLVVHLPLRKMSVVPIRGKMGVKFIIADYDQHFCRSAPVLPLSRIGNHDNKMVEAMSCSLQVSLHHGSPI